MDKGGAGISRIAGIAERAYTASFLEAMHQLSDRCPQLTIPFAELADEGYMYTHMESINKLWPSVATTSQSHFRVPNSLIIWVKQQEDNSEIEVPTQKQLLAPYYDELERVIHEMTSEDRLGNAWITSNKYKGSGNYLLPKTCVEIPDDQYKALLNLRLMMFPEVDGGLYQPTDLRQISYQCQHCNHTSSNTNSEGYQHFDMGENDEVDLRFHGLNCKCTGNVKHNRHNYIVKQLLLLFDSLKMPCRGETQLQGSNHRMDATVNLGGGATYYIDVNISNPASRSYVSTHNSDTVPFATTRHSEQFKRDKYAPIFANQQPQIAMSHFIPFIIETSGRIGEESEKFLQKLKVYARENINVDYHINKFKKNIWKIIARGNAKCFLEFHRDVKLVYQQETQSHNN